MGLFDFLKSLFGGSQPVKPVDDRPQQDTLRDRLRDRPSSLDDRDLNYSVDDAAPPPVDPQTGFTYDTTTVESVTHQPGEAPPILQPPLASGGTPQPKRKASKQRELSGLDTDKFTPLREADALAATQSADWKSAYYDSLRVIPPEDLPRIQVIDRTMVGYGLITEEELAEIHEVGRRMDAFDNQGGIIQSAGRQAVARNRAEKERIKQEKKQAAEARRAERAKAIAHRRATDIVFLGRGVSKGLADRRANIEKLSANHLPILSTPAELADAMGLSISSLRWLAFHNESPTRIHYALFQVKKKNGGVRQLAAPHKQIAAAQRWILEQILEKLPTHDAAHGFVKGRSTVSNAQPHVNADFVANFDLRDFFPTISFYRSEGLFRSIGYSPAVAAILGLLCTECPRETVSLAGQVYYPATGGRALPQGACTSPAISNLIARGLDHRLQGIAHRLGCKYTRYADDLTFSGPAESHQYLGYLMARVRHIANDEGFAIHPGKTRVRRRHSRQLVTGVVVNDKTSVPRPLVRRIRSILHNAKRTGLAAQNRDDQPNFENWLRGMIAYIEMVNPTQGAKLRSDYQALFN